MGLHRATHVSVHSSLGKPLAENRNAMRTREGAPQRLPGTLGATLALLLALFGLIAPYTIVSAATAPSLGTAQSFAVLSATGVTNTGPTTISGGNLGVSPGTAATGFPPGIVTPPGAIHMADAVALQAQSDITTAYNNLTGQPCTNDLTGQDLGGKTLTPGVYCFSSSALLTGMLTLDTQGNAGAVFVFKTGSTLTTASNSSVRVINGGSVCNAFWQIGSSATLGTGTTFVGNVLALASITLNTNATLSGRAFARGGAVTLDSNSISATACAMLSPTLTPTVAVPNATQTTIAATQTAIALTRTVIAATQNVPTATLAATPVIQVVTQSTPVLAPPMRPNTGAPNGGSGNIGAPYRIPPNGAPSSDIVPYNGQTPVAALGGTALSTPVFVSGSPALTVAAGTVVAATPSPANATAVFTATSTRMATATVVIPARLPNTGGGGMATAFTGTTDTQHGVNIAFWLTLTAILTLMGVGLLHVRRARR